MKRWGDAALEVYWKAFPGKMIRPDPTWPVSEDDLKDIVVRWPSKLYNLGMTYWHSSLANSFRRFVKVEVAPIRQSAGVVLIQIIKGGTSYDIAIDVKDQFDFINEEWAKKAFIYYKMSYYYKGYDNFMEILPGGYFP